MFLEQGSQSFQLAQAFDLWQWFLYTCLNFKAALAFIYIHLFNVYLYFIDSIWSVKLPYNPTEILQREVSYRILQTACFV